MAISSKARNIAKGLVKRTSGPMVDGFASTIAKLVGVEVAVGKLWEESAQDVAEDVLADAQSRVPVETGELRDSGFVKQEGRGFKAAFTVGFDAPYAAYVHEQVEMKLKGIPRRGDRPGRYWDPQGQAEAQFLKNALEANRGKMSNRINGRLS